MLALFLREIIFESAIAGKCAEADSNPGVRDSDNCDGIYAKA